MPYPQATQEEMPSRSINQWLTMVEDGLSVIDAILGGRDGEVAKVSEIHEVIPTDDAVQVAAKRLEEVSAHIQSLQPRLRKIARGLAL